MFNNPRKAEQKGETNIIYTVNKTPYSKMVGFKPLVFRLFVSSRITLINLNSYA